MIDSKRQYVYESVVAGYPAFVGVPASGATRPPILLLHGAFADHFALKRWVEHFAEQGHPTIAPALRGRAGVGPARAEGVTFDDYVADATAVIDTLDQTPIVVGHSLGGLIAQRLAAAGRTAALVLLASAPPFRLAAQPIALPRFGPKMPTILRGKPFIVGNDACSVLALNQVPAADRPAIHAHLTHESGKVYRALMAGAIGVDPREVTVPVFVAGGTEDRIISVRTVERTAKHYGTQAHIYPGAGHWLIDEPGTEQVLTDVESFLTTSVPG